MASSLTLQIIVRQRLWLRVVLALMPVLFLIVRACLAVLPAVCSDRFCEWFDRKIPKRLLKGFVMKVGR